MADRGQTDSVIPGFRSTPFSHACFVYKRYWRVSEASKTLSGVTQLKIGDVCLFIYVTVYRKTGHNAACVNIEKRSIDFLKMYCFKLTEGNG